MIRNSIVAKLWVTIVGMVIVVLALLTVLMEQFFDGYMYQQQEAKLQRMASSVHSLVLNSDLSVANQVALRLAEVQNATISFAVPYTKSKSLTHDYQSFTSEQRRILAAGQLVTVDNNMSSGTVSVYAQIQRQGEDPGLLVVMQRMSILDEPITRIRTLIYFATALGVVLTTGLAFVVSKNLSSPLVQMNKVAEEMAQGHFGGQIDVVTRDEVGRLGQTFNALANELSSTIAQLSVEKDQLQSILSSLEDGVLAADLEGNVTLVNPPAQKRLNSVSLATTGQLSATRLPESISNILQEVVATKHPVMTEMKLQGRQVVLTMRPLYELNGQSLRGVVAVLRDVTEERKLDTLRKDFLANVSHELRTPLSMMQGYTEALLDEFGDDPVQRRELTEIIHDETLRMRRLVADLLDLAKLESGHFPLTLEREDLTGIVKKVARKFNTLTFERELSLVTHTPSEPVVVLADYDRLEQVFTNLLDNAIRHTKSGGTITVTVEPSGEHVKVKVSDTGTGIPEEDIPYIWERFYKADKARTRGSSGTGLGLAITKYIVDGHGGDIVVESELGKGTTFTVALPVIS